MVEKSHPEKPEERQEPLHPATQRPDELRWWELQLGFALPKGLYTESATGR